MKDRRFFRRVLFGLLAVAACLEGAALAQKPDVGDGPVSSPGRTMVLTAADMPAQGKRAVSVRATVRDSSRRAVADGTVVTFATSRGEIDRQVETRGGTATAVLQYDDRTIGGARVRAWVDTLFAQVRVGDAKAARLTGRVFEKDGAQPVVARIAITDSAGQVWTPPVVADSTFDVYLPPGQVQIRATHGPEYAPSAPQNVVLRAGVQSDVALSLQRLIDMRSLGWYGGDLFVRAADAQDPGLASDMALAARAAGLQFAVFCDETPGAPGEAPGRRFLPVRGRWAVTHWGQLWVLGAADLGAFDAHTPAFVVQARAHAARGIVGYSHVFSEDRCAGELVFDVLSGPTFDALDVMSARADDRDAQRLWFALLNRGYRLTGTGFSDAPASDAFAVGRFRTYVQVEGDNSPDKLARSIADGHCVISSGPLLTFSVFAAGPGSVLPAGGARRAAIHAWAPAEEGAFLRRIELIRNGEVVQTWNLNGRPREHRVDIALSDSVDCWYLAKCYGGDSAQVALTNPIYFRTATFEPPEPVQAVIRGDVRRADGTPVPNAAVDVLDALGNVTLETTAQNGTFQVWASPTSQIRVSVAGAMPVVQRIYDAPELQALVQALCTTKTPSDLYAPKTFESFTERLSEVSMHFVLAAQP